MVAPLLLLGGAFIAKKMGLLGKGSKSGKIFDFSKGLVGDVILGLGAGAAVNYIDGMTGGNLQKLYIGSTAKGKNLNATDAVVLATTVGLGGLSGRNLQRTAAIIGGKKIGEYTGAIDPIDLTGLKSPNPASGYQAPDPAAAWGYNLAGGLSHS